MIREATLVMLILLLMFAIAFTAGVATGKREAFKKCAVRAENFPPVVFPKSKDGSATVLSPAEYCRLVGACSDTIKTLEKCTTSSPGKNRN